MLRKIVWCCVFMVTLLEISGDTKLMAQGKNNGIVHDTLIDGITFQEWGGADGEHHNGDAALATDALRLEPPALDFGRQVLALPRARRVTLCNVGNRTLALTSVSGTTPDFHASFFDDKTLPPGANTSFNVVYLGRREGPVDATLQLHTSHGAHRYAVSAVGVPNEYRVLPVLSLRVAPNGTASAALHLHNPGDAPLQVTQVYASARWLTLALIGGRPGDAQDLWRVPPHSSRPLVTVSVHHHRDFATPKRSYIRIKFARWSLLVAVEASLCAGDVRVSVEDGGGGGRAWLAGTGEGGARRTVWADNAAHEDAPVNARAQLRCGATHARTHIELHTQTIPAQVSHHRVATLHLHWNDSHAGQCTGDVTLNEENAPLAVTLLRGTLAHDDMTVATGDPDASVPRALTVTNEFHFPIYLSRLLVPEEIDLHFHRSEFVPHAMAPGERVTLVELTLREDAKPEMKTHMTLETNVTNYAISVQAYSGRLILEWEWPDPGDALRGPLELGLLAVAGSVTVQGRLVNEGPLPLCADVECSVTGASLHVAERCVSPGNHTRVTLIVRAPPVPAALAGRVTVRTPAHTEHHTMTATVRAGQLLVESVRLQHCAPYAWCSAPVKVINTFEREMHLTDTVGKEAAIKHVVLEKQKSIRIGESTLGVMLYAPEMLCQPHCYTGLTENSTDYGPWHERMRAIKSGNEEQIVEALNEDIKLWKTRRRLYQSAQLERSFEADLHTDRVKNAKVRVSARTEWPRLCAQRPVVGVAGLHTPRTFAVVLRNPSSSHAVLVQPVPFPVRGDHERVDPSLGSPCERRGPCRQRPNAFKLLDWEREGGQRVERSATVVPPGSSILLRVSFAPTEERAYPAALYLRNNLTVLEMVPLLGTGATPKIRLGNRAPGSGAPLAFPVPERSSRTCDHVDLVVRRTFTLRNAGRVGVRVLGFAVEGRECVGSGFKVFDCVGFQLMPNQSRRLEITYTHDLAVTMSSVTLSVSLSPGGVATFVLQGVMARSHVLFCAERQIRPSWERQGRWLGFAVAVGLALAVLLAAMYDAGHELFVVRQSRSGPAETLDLRSKANSRSPSPPAERRSANSSHYNVESHDPVDSSDSTDRSNLCDSTHHAEPTEVETTIPDEYEDDSVSNASSATCHTERLSKELIATTPPREPTPPPAPPTPPHVPRRLRQHKPRPPRPPGDPPRRLTAPRREKPTERKPRAAPPAPSSPLVLPSLRKAARNLQHSDARSHKHNITKETHTDMHRDRDIYTEQETNEKLSINAYVDTQINEQPDTPLNDYADRQINEPTYTRINKHTDTPINDYADRQINEPTYTRINKHTDTPINDYADRQINEPTYTRINKHTDTPINDYADRQINESTYTRINKHTDTPINDYADRQINEPTYTRINKHTDTPINDYAERQINEPTYTRINKHTDTPINDYADRQINEPTYSRINKHTDTPINDYADRQINEPTYTRINEHTDTPINDYADRQINEPTYSRINKHTDTPINDYADRQINEPTYTRINEHTDTPQNDYVHRQINEPTYTRINKHTDTPINDYADRQINEPTYTRLNEHTDTPMNDYAERQINEHEHTDDTLMNNPSDSLMNKHPYTLITEHTYTPINDHTDCQSDSSTGSGTPPALGPIAPPSDNSLFYFNRAANGGRWQDAYREESSGAVGAAVWSPPAPPSPPCWAWGWGQSGHVAPPPGFAHSQTAGMRTFDPFQSLSSIWAEDAAHWTTPPKKEDE